jgi:hypothetical protein
MAEQEKKDEPKKRLKHRSPAWPFISLGDAVERARIFYKPQREHPAPVSAAVELWDFGAKSSGGLQTVSALKQYGLMVETDGQAGHVQLTDLALRIIRDEREPSPERDAAMLEAARFPKIFAELWQKWGAKLPAEATVRYFLVQDKKYNDAAVSKLIANYKDTIKLVKLLKPDKNGSTEGAENISEGQIKTPPPPPPPKGAKLMEGERVVFTHEVEPEHGVRIVASGAVDGELIDAVEMFLELQKRRLGLSAKKPKDKSA